MKLPIILVMILGAALALAMTNPSSQDYERYREELIKDAVKELASKATGRTSQIVAQLMTSNEGLFFKSLVRSQTERRDMVFFSLYETKIFSAEVKVLGIGGRFVPLSDLEEMQRELEKSVITPGR